MKSIIKEDTCKKLYGVTKPLYLETDASVVGLRASLLQARDGMSLHRDEAPDNSIFRPIALANKSLSATKKR